MKPSSARKKVSRTQARNAALLNLLGTPGLGTLLAGRCFEGILQLLVSVAGFGLVTIWFVQMMIGYYGQMFGDGGGHPKPTFTNLVLGAVLFALAWCWSLVTSLSLFREASQVNLESLQSFTTGQIKMEPAKIIIALSTLPQWRRNGEIISRTFQFKDFSAAMKFVNDVAELAEQAQHHPDIDVRWNKVTLALTTHDAGGLTEKDFALAKQCDTLSVR